MVKGWLHQISPAQRSYLSARGHRSVIAYFDVFVTCESKHWSCYFPNGFCNSSTDSSTLSLPYSFLSIAHPSLLPRPYK